MRLSRNFVKDYIDLSDDLTIKEIAEAMTNVGNEYDSAEKLIPCTKLITGLVLECTHHPDSDHLHVCKVDIGKEVLEIVCGAPNVRKDLKVIVAQTGAKLPKGEIKAGKIRGVISNGMLCSKEELGLDHKFLEAKDSDGIHELPADTPIGVDPIKVLGLDDEVIDFELTANRGDLLSILGMAYELGSIYHLKVKDIDLTHQEINENIKDAFNIKIETEDCPLFLAKKIKNVTIKESPDFIKNRLIASGIRPINNVVDISNYVMLETGQPLHFYDANKLGDTIIVRNAKDNEELTTLDNISHILNSEDIVIANQNEAVALAGVMGGLNTEITPDTKDIIIESAIFNGTKIRKTSKKIVRSEASNRFEKGLDPNRSYMAIERCCHLLEKYANATILSGMLSYDKTDKADKVIKITKSKITKVLGLDIPLDTIIAIYNDLGFKVEVANDELTVTVPRRRLDVNIKEDLITEVGRIYGMDKIKGKLPILDVVTGTYNKFNRELKHKLVDLGLNETLSYTLISDKEVRKYTTKDLNPITLKDPMSEERSTLRYSLLPSLMNIYNYNKDRGNKDISIFEIGKSFYQQDNSYKEEEHLAILMTGNYYLGLNKEKVDFYIIKGILEQLLDYLGYPNRYDLEVGNTPKELHPNISASITLQHEPIGFIGKVHPKETKDDIYVLELNLTKLKTFKETRMAYKEIPKFPSVIKDVAFIIKDEITANTILKEIKKAGGNMLTNMEVFDVYKGDKVEVGYKSMAINLTFASKNRTLNDEEVMEVFNKIINRVTTTLNAKLRDN